MKALTILALAVAVLPAAPLAQSPAKQIPLEPRAVTPANRSWQPFGLAGRVTVRGDLSDGDCPSVTLLRLRPGTRLPPHASPRDRTFVVLSGTVHVGVGERWDESRLRALPPGSFWVVPANTSTFEWNEDEVVAEVTVIRPARDCPRPDAPAFVTPDRIGWKPSGTLERAVLLGDPGEPGCPSSVRYRLPAGTSLPEAFDRTTDDRTWTVLSGSLAAPGAGKEGTKAPVLPAGTVIALPAGRGAAAVSGENAEIERDFAGTGPRICRLREILR